MANAYVPYGYILYYEKPIRPITCYLPLSGTGSEFKTRKASPNTAYAR